jgi:hydrogenase-4 component F
VETLTLLLLVPTLGGAIVWFLPGPRAVLGWCVAGSLGTAGIALALAIPYPRGRSFALDQQLFFDALSAFHTLVVVGVFAASSIYARSYFAPAIEAGTFDTAKARRFGVLWFGFLASMLLTLAANNVGLMWVGMEATTVVSALLICLDRDPPSIRAAWTYLLMCSVAVAVALLGILVIIAEAQGAAPESDVSRWTDLYDLGERAKLGAGPLKLSFLFALVGYGTKAGLAPMHSWLPEAHGQAPTPVSAVLSGVLLNCAIYSLSRFLPVVESTGSRWTSQMLVLFGLVSIGVAATFIITEKNVKRLLAFSSVEHMGIITLALGVGAVKAGLFHTLNHSVAKMLSFFCAGALVQRYGTRDMGRMHRVLRELPVAGMGFLLGLLVIIGMPPFAVFMSEIWIARDGVDHGHIVPIAIFAAGAAVIFIAAFRHLVEIVWDRPGDPAPPATGTTRLIAWPLVALPFCILVVLGVWMPEDLGDMLGAAAELLGPKSGLAGLTLEAP